MSVSLPIDHVVVLVPDLDAAGTAFEAAGFHVTPKAQHSPAMGTANRCIMLQGSYVELLGIDTETPANATWRALLASGSGIRGIALRSGDIEASAAQLEALGIPAEAVRHFSRQTEAGELRFSITRIDPQATPGLQCLVCQHHTADLLWIPDAMRHENGASRMRSVALPQAEIFERFPRDGTAFGIDLVRGSGRLMLSGSLARSFDLRDICGVEIEVIAT